jgi:3'-phosphoadenosine 5'-phosphosulfate (PAPS) 3'-phosphatase
MLLTSENLQYLAGCAIEAAQIAGKYISETRPLNVQRKKGGDSLASQVVTEVDAKAQELILQILEPTLPQFDLALLTEENEDDRGRLEKDWFWCIDPIDGTLPFIDGTPGYAVSIALVAHDGTSHVGAVYDPVEQILYHAIKDHGAFRNSKPWSIRDQGSRLQLITDRSFKDHTQYSEIIAGLSAIASDMNCSGLEPVMHGGACMNACWVLENAPACYFKFPKTEEGGGSLWDYAATACLFHEAGAVATDIHGSPLDLNRPDSTFMNHRGILYASDAKLARRIMDLYAQLK